MTFKPTDEADKIRFYPSGSTNVKISDISNITNYAISTNSNVVEHTIDFKNGKRFYASWRIEPSGLFGIDMHGSPGISFEVADNGDTLILL